MEPVQNEQTEDRQAKRALERLSEQIERDARRYRRPLKEEEA